MSGFSKASEILDKIGLPKIAEGSEIEQKSQPVVAEAPSRPATKPAIKPARKLKLPSALQNLLCAIWRIDGRMVYRYLNSVSIEELPSVYQEKVKDIDIVQHWETKEIYLYTRKDGTEQITYVMPKALLDQKPNFALMERCLLGSILMAFEQKRPIIQFTASEKLEKLGFSVPASGKVYREWLTAERALACTLIGYRNEKFEFIGTVSTFIYDGEKGRYIVGLNPYLFEPYINFATGEVQSPYIVVELPFQVKPETNRYWRYGRNLRMQLAKFRGLRRLPTITGETLLEWAGVPLSKRKRKELQGWVYKEATKILLEWGFRPVEPVRKIKGFRKLRLNYELRETEPGRLIPEERAIAKEIAKWLVEERPGKYTVRGAQVRVMWCIRTYGVEAVYKCYKCANSYRDFWESITALKERRKEVEKWKQQAKASQVSIGGK